MIPAALESNLNVYKVKDIIGEYWVRMNKAGKNRLFLMSVVISAGLFTALTLMPAYADSDNAVLSGIEINSQDSVFNGNKYQITLKTDKNINIEKTAPSSDKIVLDLKNTTPSQYVNTVYNNASGIDNVIVQPVSDNEVKIFLQGSNIVSSKISLDSKGIMGDLNDKQPPVPVSKAQNKTVQNTEHTPQTVIDMSENQAQNKVNIAPQPEKIVLNKPIDNFKPAIREEDTTLNNNDDSMDSLKNGIAGLSLHKIFNKNRFDWVLRFLTITFMIVVGIKLFKPKRNIKIDLSSNKIKDRDLDLIKSINSRRDLIGTGLKTGNKDFANKPGYNSFSQYGIKEYQNSQNPPSSLSSSSYKSSHEPKFMKTPIKPASGINNQALKKAFNNPTTQTATSRTPLQSKVKTSNITEAKVNIDNKKFLESMAQIYAKSGRTDLAQGIQSNILKNQR